MERILEWCDKHPNLSVAILGLIALFTIIFVVYTVKKMINYGKALDLNEMQKEYDKFSD